MPELARHGLSTYREVVVAPWRLVYRVADSQVLILVVVDGRRNVEDVLLERLLRLS